MARRQIELMDRYTINGDEFGHCFEKEEAKLPKSYHRILDLLTKHMGSSLIKPLVLDLAMGAGDTSTYMQKKRLRVVKADLSILSLKQNSGERVEVFAEELPFKDDTFDAIHFKDAMVHIEKKPKFFQEISRILKPGGVFLLTTVLSQLSYYCFYNSCDELHTRYISNIEDYCKRVRSLEKMEGVLFIGPPYFRTEGKDILAGFQNNRMTILENTTWQPKNDEKDWYQGTVERKVYLARKN
jgi:SAM-dependent methyltransferase